MSSDARTTTPTSHNTASETPPSGKSLSLTISAHKSKSSAALHKSRTPLLNGTKRSHTSLHEFENDVEETEIQSELVSLFDHAAGGAIGYGGPQAKGAPLVITRLKNRDWREESRRKRGGQNLLPREVQEAQRNGVEPRDGTDEAGKGDGISETYGLTFLRTENKRTKEKESTVLVNEVTVGSHSEAENENEGLPPREKTDDEVALEALTSGKSGRVSTLLLPALETSVNGRFTYGSVGGISEDDAFRADVLSRPDSASMADYASVPVEEFGAALLRGMGWKEGEVVGKRKDAYSKPRTVERRPALLGLGAKDVPSGIGEELGAWGKAAAAKGKSRRPDLTYNPVVLKNSRTGEMLTEEELMGKTEERAKSKKESEERKEDWRDRRDRNLRIDAEKKDRDRGDVGSGSKDRGRGETRREGHRSRDRHREYDRHTGSNSRDRSRSSDGLDRRRRRYDDDNQDDSAEEDRGADNNSRSRRRQQNHHHHHHRRPHTDGHRSSNSSSSSNREKDDRHRAKDRDRRERNEYDHDDHRYGSTTGRSRR